MREVSVQRLTEAISEAVILANTVMTPDIEARLHAGLSDEATPVARAVISDLLENAAIARAEHVPMCQDTGMVVVYLTFGQDVRWLDGSVEEAINEGVRRGYREVYGHFGRLRLRAARRRASARAALGRAAPQWPAQTLSKRSRPLSLGQRQTDPRPASG